MSWNKIQINSYLESLTKCCIYLEKNEASKKLVRITYNNLTIVVIKVDTPMANMLLYNCIKAAMLKISSISCVILKHFNGF